MHVLASEHRALYASLRMNCTRVLQTERFSPPYDKNSLRATVGVINKFLDTDALVIYIRTSKISGYPLGISSALFLEAFLDLSL